MVSWKLIYSFKTTSKHHNSLYFLLPLLIKKTLEFFHNLSNLEEYFSATTESTDLNFLPPERGESLLSLCSTKCHLDISSLYSITGWCILDISCLFKGQYTSSIRHTYFSSGSLKPQLPHSYYFTTRILVLKFVNKGVFFEEIQDSHFPRKGGILVEKGVIFYVQCFTVKRVVHLGWKVSVKGILKGFYIFYMFLIVYMYIYKYYYPICMNEWCMNDVYMALPPKK